MVAPPAFNAAATRGNEVTGFPFSAVVGMAELRLGLVLNAVSPGIGGVLVRGEKGTAKSTMVRALAAILPDVEVVAGCRFSCDPAAPDPSCPDGPHEPGAASVTRPARLVELPVGASEDRLVGALDIERALTEGVKAYEPGLLAAAHRGVLYVDEVNLLHDHLVDLLLDAAALGTCYVERDGVSVQHAARFLLVGTMNPEEGELRPQLLDRFGLTVEAAAPREPGLRGEVVRRRLAYDADPAAFTAAWQDAESGLAARIVAAQGLLPGVVLPDATLRQVASVCAAFDVDGLRADLVTARAAIAHAAWEGRGEVTAMDVRAAARLALPHRRRRQPFDAPQLDEEELDRALAGAGEDPDDDPGPGDDGPGGGEPEASHETTPAQDAPSPRAEAAPDPGPDGQPPGPAAEAPAQPRPGAAPAGPPAAPGPVFRVKRLEVPGTGTGAAGRRSRARTESGHVTGAQRPRDRAARIHVPATCGRRATRDGSPTWSCSWWTPAARWRPGPGWARSRARCCPCCWMPTSAGTRSAWSRSAAAGPNSRSPPRSRSRQRPRGCPRCRPAGAPRWRRACSGPGTCSAPNASATRAAARCWYWLPTAAPPAARTRWPGRTGRRGCWQRRGCTAWSSTASPARSGWTWRVPWLSPSAASCSAWSTWPPPRWPSR